MTFIKRRRITYFIFSVILGILFYALIASWQSQKKSSIPITMPITIREQLLSLMSEDEMAFDKQNPESLIIIWKDLPIKLGDPQDFEYKIRLLKKIFPIIQSRYDIIEYVDIRYPENITIKYFNQAKINDKPIR